jgi:hypothetical protein
MIRDQLTEADCVGEYRKSVPRTFSEKHKSIGVEYAGQMLHHLSSARSRIGQLSCRVWFYFNSDDERTWPLRNESGPVGEKTIFCLPKVISTVFCSPKRFAPIDALPKERVLNWSYFAQTTLTILHMRHRVQPREGGRGPRWTMLIPIEQE